MTSIKGPAAAGTISSPAFIGAARARQRPLPNDGQGSNITLDLTNVNTNSPQYQSAARVCAIKPGP